MFGFLQAATCNPGMILFSVFLLGEHITPGSDLSSCFIGLDSFTIR